MSIPSWGWVCGYVLGGATLLAGCNIDTAAAEFYARYTTGGEGGGEASGSAAGSTSSGEETTTGGSTGAGESTAGSGEAAADTSGAPDGGSSGDRTTGTAAVCGNGVIEADEECDDGDADDADECDNACAAAWTIFVTATNEGNLGYTGKINGLEGADTRCRKHALDGGLPRHLSYKALISDSTVDAADRLHHARGYYRLVNGLPVAHGWDALMNGPLDNPVSVTELGTTFVISVWTGTQPGGTAVPGSEHCGGWDVEGNFITGHYGISSEVDGAWLMDPDPNTNPTSCYGENSLYCVEQP